MEYHSESECNKPLQWTRYPAKEPRKSYAKWKKSDKRLHRNDSISMKFIVKTNLKQQKTDQWLPGTRSGSKSWLQKKKNEEIFGVTEIF